MRRTLLFIVIFVLSLALLTSCTTVTTDIKAETKTNSQEKESRADTENEQKNIEPEKEIPVLGAWKFEFVDSPGIDEPDEYILALFSNYVIFEENGQVLCIADKYDYPLVDAIGNVSISASDVSTLITLFNAINQPFSTNYSYDFDNNVINLFLDNAFSWFFGVRSSSPASAKITFENSENIVVSLYISDGRYIFKAVKDEKERAYDAFVNWLGADITGKYGESEDQNKISYAEIKYNSGTEGLYFKTKYAKNGFPTHTEISEYPDYVELIGRIDYDKTGRHASRFETYHYRTDLDGAEVIYTEIEEITYGASGLLLSEKSYNDYQIEDYYIEYLKKYEYDDNGRLAKYSVEDESEFDNCTIYEYTEDGIIANERNIITASTFDGDPVKLLNDTLTVFDEKSAMADIFGAWEFEFVCSTGYTSSKVYESFSDRIIFEESGKALIVSDNVNSYYSYNDSKIQKASDPYSAAVAAGYLTHYSDNIKRFSFDKNKGTLYLLSDELTYDNYDYSEIYARVTFTDKNNAFFSIVSNGEDNQTFFKATRVDKEESYSLFADYIGVDITNDYEYSDNGNTVSIIETVTYYRDYDEELDKYVEKEDSGYIKFEFDAGCPISGRINYIPSNDYDVLQFDRNGNPISIIGYYSFDYPYKKTEITYNDQFRVEKYITYIYDFGNDSWVKYTFVENTYDESGHMLMKRVTDGTEVTEYERTEEGVLISVITDNTDEGFY